MAKSAKKLAAGKLRNRIALNPLLKKGGVHDKTRKAERRRVKQQLAGESHSD